ncbi:MAG TPA: C40 family peptidase [Egibacteraceae bacterium]|nr:C40 family peptidase [Egibacteraceae bacterium]
MPTIDAVSPGVPPVAPTGTATPTGAAFAAALAAALGEATRPSPASTARPVTLGEMVATLPPGMATPAAPAMPPPPASSAEQSRPPTAGDRGAVVAAASRYLGVPYRWAGTDPSTGLDCSGFVQRVFADLGVATRRVSRDQSRAGVAVPSLAEARPGDLVYWNGHGGRPNHIAIYAGDGQMIHAPRTGDVVKYAPVRTAPPDAIRRML